MTFTVTYRDKTGTRREEALEAVNRAACVAACRARGISPLAIREGAKGQVGNKGTHGVKGLVFVVAVAILAAGGLWWWFGGCGVSTTVDNASKTVKMPKRIHAPAARTNTRPPVALPPSAPQTILKPSPSATSTPTHESPPVGEAEEEEGVKAKTKQLFSTGSEQVMAWIFTCPIGKMPPMLPSLPPEELARIGEILDSPNIIDEDDNEHAATTKEIVAQVKRELKKFLSEGGKVEDFLGYYHGILLQAHQKREGARVAVEQFSETDPDLAGNFKAKVNTMLRAEGIDELDSDDVIDNGQTKETDK